MSIRSGPVRDRLAPGLDTITGERSRLINLVFRPGLVVRSDGVTVAVLAFDVEGDRITHIWAILNPDKLRPWATDLDTTVTLALNRTGRPPDLFEAALA